MIELIKAIGPACIGLATAVVTFICSKCSSKKKDKVIKVAKILQKLPGLITTFEENSKPGTGRTKKQLVLNQIQIECLSQGIEYIEEEWSEEIEKILETPQKKETANEI